MPAVDAADPAGGHEPDPGHRRDVDRGRDRRRAGLVAGERRPEVPGADLSRGGGDAFDLFGAESDAQPAVEHRDGGRHAALGANRLFATPGRAQVVRGGKALAEDRGLQRHHRTHRGERLGDLGRDDEQGAQLGRAPAARTDRVAACTACSAASSGAAPRSQALQNAAANASPAPVGSTACTGGAVIVLPNTRHPPGPSLSTGTWARLSRGTASVSASASVANNTSGLSRASTYAMRDGPYARSPAADDRSTASIPLESRTRWLAARLALSIGSRTREYAATWRRRASRNHDSSKSSGPSPTLAPRCVAIVRRPSRSIMTAIAPVGSAAQAARTSTPRASRSATRRRPVSSSPTRVTSRAPSPNAAVQAQKFAAWPPPPSEMCAGVSSSAWSGASRAIAMSSSRSPMETIKTRRG